MWIGGVALLGCVGGAVGLAVALTVGVARILIGRWRRLGSTVRESVWAAAAFGAYAAAGVLLAIRPAGSDDYAGDGWAVQVLALVALAAVVFSVPLTTRSAAAARR